MKELIVRDFVNITDAELICGDENEVLYNFKNDTREIKEGDTYVGIKGDSIDGSTLYEKAFQMGAKVCIIENIEIDKEILKKYHNKIILQVEDSVKALQKVAKYKRGIYDIPVIRSNRKCWKNKYKRYDL